MQQNQEFQPSYPDTTFTIRRRLEVILTKRRERERTAFAEHAETGQSSIQKDE